VMIRFQHVEFLKVNRVRDRGRCRKTWNECVKKDLVELGLHRQYIYWIELGMQKPSNQFK